MHLILSTFQPHVIRRKRRNCGPTIIPMVYNKFLSWPILRWSMAAKSARGYQFQSLST